MLKPHIWMFCFLAAACVWGPRIEDLPSANSGAGASVRVFRTNGDVESGELLGWSADGLLLRRRDTAENESLYLIVEPDVRSIEIPGVGVVRGNAARQGLGNARHAARYLRRIDSELLEHLLTAYGQTALVRSR
jgi:hypothetical protein